jgi:O-antigen/teichoic acid export membrane protein
MIRPSSVAFNTLAQTGGKVLTLLFGLATTALIYRTLGTSQYGIYVFVTSFVLLFATVSDWGTEIITIREASRKPKLQGEIFGTAVILRLTLSLIAVLLSNIAIRIFPGWKEFVIPVSLFSLALIGVTFKTTAAAVFLTYRVALWSAISEIINNGLYFLCVLTIIPKSPHLLTALYLLVASTFIAGFISIIWAAHLSPLSVKLNSNYGKVLLKEAFPTGALLTIFYIYNRVDVVILQSIKGNEAVGIYGLAYKIHDNLVQGAAFLMNAVFPIISANPSAERLRTTYQRTFHILLLGALLLLLLLLLFAPWIITLVGGQSATPSITALRILAFATFVAYLNHLTGYTLIAIGHQRTSLLIAAIALVVNIFGNFVLIPHFSYIGSSFMTIATEGIVFLLSSSAIFRYTGILPSLTNILPTIILALKTRGRIFE